MSTALSTRAAKWRSSSFVDASGVVLLGLAAAWVLWNLFSAPTQFARVMAIGVSNGALFALIALGYTMVYGIIELINFSHGDLFMLGSVFSAIMMEQWFNKRSSSATAWLLLGVTMVATMIACAALNMLAERLAYRRLRNAPKLAPLIAAVGISYIYQNIAIYHGVNGSAPKSRTTVLPKSSIKLGSIEIRIAYLVVAAVTVPLLLLMTYVVQKTKTGKAMRATAQDRDAAALMGINVNRIISITFGIGGALAGAAGVLFVQVNGQTRYDAGFRLGLIAFTAAVLGGVGNLLGAVVGGMLIGIIQALNDGAPHGFGQKWTQTVMFTILIVMVVVRPSGLFGSHTQEKV